MLTARDMEVDPYYLMDRQAERSPIGANRLIYLPYLMGERSPLLDSHARGAFIGLSAIHTKRDMLRAVMEGVIFSSGTASRCWGRWELPPARSRPAAAAEAARCGGR
jgi:sugar (pentulose or hexulose) kinase